MTPEIDFEKVKLERRRRLAEAMAANAMQPMGPTEFAGGIAVRKSPMEGVAKVAQAYMAESDMRDVDQQTKDLGDRQRQDVQNAMSDYMRRTTPRAAVAGALNEDASGNVYMTDNLPAYTPTPEEKRAAAMDLMGRIGNGTDAAKMLVAEALRPQELKAYKPGDVLYQGGTKVGEIPKPADPFTLAPGATRYGPDGKPIVAAPAAPTEISRLITERDALPAGDPRRAVLDDAIKKATTHQPATTVNVSAGTEKKYGEQFAGAVAKQDVDLLDAARKAPELADRANQVKAVLASGKVITGTGADYRLALGKALNLAGASDAETVSNTEALSVNLARNTLDAIKASGLGSGSGFSNADRDFLEKAAGGKINLEAATIGRLADLSHRAATKSADAWTQRVRNIPDSALQGTGIKRDPVVVPPLFGAQAKPGISDRTKSLLDKYAPEGQ